MKDKNIIWIIGLIILGIFLFNNFNLGEFALTPSGEFRYQTQRGDTDFMENDQLFIIYSREPDWSAKKPIILINDKYYSGDKDYFGFYQDWLKVDLSGKENYDSVGLKAGKNFVEVFYIPRASDCRSMTGTGRPGEACDTNPRYDSITIVIGKVTEPSENVIKLIMTNTGSQNLNNIELLKEGTTPEILYTSFSDIKQFNLNPGGQVIFFANIDTSEFDGTVPFQMSFKADYGLNNDTYSLYRFTDPLQIEFEEGVIKI